jgi:hypothetical protein
MARRAIAMGREHMALNLWFNGKIPSPHPAQIKQVLLRFANPWRWTLFADHRPDMGFAILNGQSRCHPVYRGRRPVRDDRLAAD